MSSASRKRKAVGKQPSKECGADEWDSEEGRRRQRNGEGVTHAENSGPPPSKANREVPGGVFATMQDAERAGTEAEVSHSIELQPGSETNMQTLAETFAWQRASSALAELRAWRGCRKGERRRGEQGNRRQHSTPGRKHWEEKGRGRQNGAWCLHGFA
ncbi:hypothetical protein ERJ75_001471800 [Trypanosoma vivax]|nr:hypothetical protein ERJ75_001471800 [Trypanosoma vivax]